jgi:NAD(P)-dependent dehydrogenase (short-subunit alcohol dehydrogenase family)
MAIADVTNKSIAELVSLKGRCAVVTGGGRGLGKAIAKRLAEAGAAVVIGDIIEENAKTAAAEIAKACNAKVIGQYLDVADSASISSIADAAVKHCGSLDIWVSNAAIFPVSPIVEMKDEEWDKVTAVDLRGVFIGSREAARRMIAGGRGGVIISIASTAGFKGIGPGLPHYVASKHGIRGLTRQMALELGPQNIRVLAVAPGLTATEGMLSSTKENSEAQNIASGSAGELAKKQFLGRMGRPDDIARAVLFCASDMSMFMSGSTLLVDGGETV